MLFVQFAVLVDLCFPLVSIHKTLINDGIVGSLSGCGQGVERMKSWGLDCWAPGHKASCPGQPPPDQIMVTEPGAREGEGDRLAFIFIPLLKGGVHR